MFGSTSCDDTPKSYSASFVPNPFTPIEEYKNEGLVYRDMSKTIYILCSESQVGDVGYGYLAPYIQNGHFYEYIDGKIVEIIPELNSSSPDEEKESLLKK